MGFLSSLAPIVGGGIGAFFGGPAGALAGASAGGSVTSALGAADANQGNLAMSQHQMDFQERMSSTAHQREVSDLRNAGLNPMLSANAGASSPAGSSAQMQNEAPDFSHAVSTAMEARMANQNLENLKEQNKLTQMQTKKTELDAETSFANQGIAKNEAMNSTKLNQARAGILDTANPENKYWNDQANLEKTEFSARSTEARRSKIDNDYGIKHSTLLNNMDTAQKGANVISTGASVIKPFTSTTGQIKDNRKTHYHVDKLTGEIKK